MAASTSKKVVAVRFDREPIRGYIAPATYLGAESLEILTPDGTLLSLPYADLKLVAFVKSWDEPWDDVRKSFVSRPKGAGLWVRFDFRDGDSFEALLPANLVDWPASGYIGTPPDSARNTQRLFVPRLALRQCTVLGAIGSGRRPALRQDADSKQLKMFD